MSNHDHHSSTKRLAWGAGAMLLIVALGLGVYAAWRATVSHVGAKIEAEANSAGVALRYGGLDVRPDGVVRLSDVDVSRGRFQGHFDRIEADVRVFSTRIFEARPSVQTIEVEGGHITFDSPSREQEELLANGSASVSVASMLRQVSGGSLPRVTLRNIQLASNSDSAAIRIEEASSATTEDSWVLEAKLAMRGGTSGLELPDHATARATIPLEPGDDAKFESVRVDMDEPMAVRIRTGLEMHVPAVSVTPEGATLHSVELHGPAVRLIALKPVRVDRVRAAPLSAIFNEDFDALESMRLDGLQVTTTLDALRSLAHDSKSLAPSGPTSIVSASSPNWSDRVGTTLREAFSAGDILIRALRDNAPRLLEIEQSRVDITDHDLVLENLSLSWARSSTGGAVGMQTDVLSETKPRGQLEALYESDKAPSRVRLTVEDFDLALGRTAFDEWPLEGRGDVMVHVEERNGVYPVGGEMRAREATLTVPMLVETPLEIADATFQFEAHYHPHSRQMSEPTLIRHPTGGVQVSREDRRGVFETESGVFKANDLTVKVDVDVYGLASLPREWPVRIDIEASVDPTPVQAFFDAAPPQLLGGIHGSKFSGDLGLTGRIEIPLRNASRTQWNVDKTLDDFGIQEMPHNVDVRRMMGGMQTTIGHPNDGCEMTVRLPPMRSEHDPMGRRDVARPVDEEGCAPWRYIPLDDISRHMELGVLTTEDGAFFRHRGFNEQAIKRSLEKNLEEHRFVRGASTIPMQLAKNLFLSHDKNGARKLREAFLVWLMEQVVEVPKKRILEVYLNVIQYGPGVYGIWSAARHYFGTTPAKLSVGEVAWLVSILQDPAARHRYFERGYISDAWWARMSRLIDAMYIDAHIDEHELLTAKAERPRFRNADHSGSGALNDPHQFEDELEPLAEHMRKLRAEGVERSELVRWSDAPLENASAYRMRERPGGFTNSEMRSAPDEKRSNE